MSSPDLRAAVGAVLDWPVPHAAAALVGADGVTRASAGEQDRVFRLGFGHLPPADFTEALARLADAL